MLSIGDFARFAGVSVRMLRHYDAVGLLRPSYVDPATGYRQYQPELLARADALVALKELGFPLEQVGKLLDADLSPSDMRALLDSRRAELCDQIAADSARLDEVERRLRMMEGESTMTTALEYVEKSLPALRLTQLTGRVDDITEIGPEIGPMFDRLGAALEGTGADPEQPGVAWYDADGDGIRFGAAFPAGNGGTPDGFESGELPAVDRAVTAVYRGSMEHIGEAWQTLAHHATSQGLEFAGPCREVYLSTPPNRPDDWVTELQQPVR